MCAMNPPHMLGVTLLLFLLRTACGTQLAAFSESAWRRVQQYPMQVGEAGGGLVLTRNTENPFELMVFGGYISGLKTTGNVYSYSLGGDVNHTWTRRANMPSHLTHCGQIAVGIYMYTCGGYLGTHPGPSVTSCFRYNALSNIWDNLPGLPMRSAGGALLYHATTNSLVFAGGALREAGLEPVIDRKETYTLSLHDLEKGWKRMADMPHPRNHMAGAMVGTRLFFVGGQLGTDEYSGNTNHTQEFIVEENKWVERADVPYPVGHVSASTPAYGPGFFVIGGVINGRKKTNKVLYYNMNEDKYYDVGHYPVGVQTPVCGVAYDTMICATSFGRDLGALAYTRSVKMMVT